MKYFFIEPDVPGRLSPDTIKELLGDNLLKSIGYVFECWPDEDIAQADPFYIASERLTNTLLSHAFTGFKVGACKSEKGDQFDLVSPGHNELPKFNWLIYAE